MGCLAFDVGGANIKYSDGSILAGSEPFALWKYPEQLADELRAIVCKMPVCDRFAVTMTGELADCFASKSEGVLFILDAVRRAVAGRPLKVFLTDGRLVDMDVARSNPRLAAASNWLALACFAGRYAPAGAALLFDVGSTTCDLIPLDDGRPTPAARDDTSRLVSGELVYTGVERSPVCAVADRVMYRGQACPLAQELFATMRDVYLVLGDVEERPGDCETADGRPATRAAAVARLGRMICADSRDFSHEDALALARIAAGAQAQMVGAALQRVTANSPSPPGTAILSGHGSFLARRVLAQSGLSPVIVSLVDVLGADVARAATAYALAVLTRESDPS
jgi:probable H4MPT-linked C1 transfer pathway protein